VLAGVAAAFFASASAERAAASVTTPAVVWSDEESMPDWQKMQVGNWTEMVPGPFDTSGTVCARGTPFSFFVRKGSTDNVVYEFEGGGACWSKSTCQTTGSTFKDTADNTRAAMRKVAQGKRRVSGLADSEGPYGSWTHVYVPYCTSQSLFPPLSVCLPSTLN
jgi:hypothetical protein